MGILRGRRRRKPERRAKLSTSRAAREARRRRSGWTRELKRTVERMMYIVYILYYCQEQFTRYNPVRYGISR